MLADEFENVLLDTVLSHTFRLLTLKIVKNAQNLLELHGVCFKQSLHVYY